MLCAFFQKTILLLLVTTSLFSEELFPPLDHAIVSIYAIDTKTGEVIIDKNSDLSSIPASCMKIVTTGAALHLLGPDSCFKTYLEYDGMIDDTKSLFGNIYIRGGGDPCLGSDRCRDSLSWNEQIKVWANAIQEIGIRKIEGKIIADASMWEKALAPPSWEWEDLASDYGAGASALSFHENNYSLFFRPGKKPGETAMILRSEPFLSGLTFYNEVKTGPIDSKGRVCIYGSEYSPIQFVRGTVPASIDEFVINGVMPDSATCCSDLLTQELLARGISLGNKDIAQKARTAFHTTLSPKIREIVFWANQKSVNLYAEHLLKKMGEVVYNEGSTKAGTQAVKDFWSAQGIDLNGFHMADGSGLSRKNLITAKQLVEILLKMKSSKFFPIFFESLPQKKSMIRAKSGTMSLIRGYAGYAGDITFSVLVNQCLERQKMLQSINTFLINLNQRSN